MRTSVLTLLAMLLSGNAHSVPLKPMQKGSFDGIPFEQAMSTLHVLGKWILPRHGTIQVFTVAGSGQKGCIGAETDPDHCNSARLYVAAEDSLIESHVKPDGFSTNFGKQAFFLLRGVNGTGWYLSEKADLKFNTNDRFSLLVCGSKFTTKLSGGAIIPTAYILHISRRLENDKKYSFEATMAEDPSQTNFNSECGAAHMMGRDENFRTDPSLVKPGKAPR